jgi:hypothetical protein
VELRFLKFCEVFQKPEAFLKHLNRKCEAFLKISRLFEDIFRKMKALIRNLKIFIGIEAFLK